MKHAYVVTENIPEVEGLPNIRDHDASIYFRVQEQSLCMGGYETNPILLEKVWSIYTRGPVGLSFMGSEFNPWPHLYLFSSY
jgi:hypothetical protein